ncbi:MAG: GNAT family N-acetyltransferase [Opitutaceae bacterium]
MIPRRLDPFTLRLAEPNDRAACYAVCLGTGDSGRDATHLHADPDALGHVYVGAYLAFAPEFALVLEDAAGVCGYALAALDTRDFQRRYVEEWLPPLRKLRPAPSGPAGRWSRDEALWNLYHHPELFTPEPYAGFPSHLHIDLLPRAQGRGLGRTMMTELLQRLTVRGSPGVHLAMAADNHRAAAFYARLGFRELARGGDAIYLGRSLP